MVVTGRDTATDVVNGLTHFESLKTAFLLRSGSRCV
jgi:hypothetical protein